MCIFSHTVYSQRNVACARAQVCYSAVHVLTCCDLLEVTATLTLYHVRVMPCMQVQRQAQKDLQTGALNDDTVSAYFQQHMQKVLESFWKINVTDIESTLEQVVAQVRVGRPFSV